MFHTGGRALRSNALLGYAIVLIACFLWLQPVPEGLSPRGWLSIIIFVFVAGLWATEIVSLPLAALVAIILQPLLGVSDMASTLSGFASNAVFLILAGFMLGSGLIRSHLDKRIAYKAIRLSRNSGTALLGIIAVTALLSMIISNTATVLLMVPIVLTLARRAGLDKKAFLIATCYSANIGGVGLLIGTPPNVMAAEASGVGFFEWAGAGLPFVAAMLPLLYLSLCFQFKPHGVIHSSVLSGLEDLGGMNPKEKRCAAVLAATLLLWATTPFHGVSAVVIGLLGGFAMLFLVSGWNFFENHTNWGVIILMGGAISISNMLISTGAASWIAGRLLEATGLTSPALITFSFAVLGMGITQFIQNTATAGMLIPLLSGISQNLGISSHGLMIVPVIATSMTFLMPPGTAPNAIVHGTGYVSVRDMLKAGVLPTISAILLVLIFSFLI